MTEFQDDTCPPEPVQAVLVVDMQRAFLVGDDAFDGAGELVERVAGTVSRCREAGYPVVLVQNDGRVGEPDEVGSAGWDLAIEPHGEDLVVNKSVDDAFLETDLEARLSARGVGRLAVVGIFSEMCVAATARGAMVRGFDVVLAHDGHHASDVPPWPGVASGVPEEHTRRVAEWSLGDGVDLVASLDDVRFGPAQAAPTGPPSPGPERLA